MNKTDEVINQVLGTLSLHEIDVYKFQVKKLMQKYAEIYAKQHCENLYEKMGHWSKCSVEELRKLILETELPEHE